MALVQVTDDTVAASLQDQYLSGNKRMLSALYCEVKRIAEGMLPKMASGVHRELATEEMQTMAHDAASRLVARYLRPEGYHVQFFCKATWRECQYQLFDGGHQDRPGKKVEREMISVESFGKETSEPKGKSTPVRDKSLQIPKELWYYDKGGNGNGHEDIAYSFQDIMADHPKGSDAIVDIYRSKSYREAIETIAQYLSRRFILDHAVRLKYVYKNTRRHHAKSTDQHTT